jgi:hypothetical protein
MIRESLDAGALGTTIRWKQVGHSMVVPLLLSVDLMCWLHTGQVNLNSRMVAGSKVPANNFIKSVQTQCGF